MRLIKEYKGDFSKRVTRVQNLQQKKKEGCLPECNKNDCGYVAKDKRDTKRENILKKHQP